MTHLDARRKRGPRKDEGGTRLEVVLLAQVGDRREHAVVALAVNVAAQKVAVLQERFLALREKKTVKFRVASS